MNNVENVIYFLINEDKNLHIVIFPFKNRIWYI